MAVDFYSQAYQDLFVLSVLGYKKNGTFLEIGSNDPVKHNNTYTLEKNFFWTGLMVEYDGTFETYYKKLRPCSRYIINDATIINYGNALKSLHFPKSIDYLQIDLDVDNESTLKTLKLIDTQLLDEYKFATVTFEHDIYRGNFFNTRQISRQIFTDRGYVLLFPDVQVFWENAWCPFEDWYVHPDLVNKDLISQLMADVKNLSLRCDDVKQLLSQINK